MPLIGGGVFLLIFLMIALLFAFTFGLSLIGARGARARIRSRRTSSPERLLRERYVQGEIGRRAYLDALTDVLKDRYIRGELTPAEYEERLSVLLEPPDSVSPHQTEHDELPPPE